MPEHWKSCHFLRVRLGEAGEAKRVLLLHTVKHFNVCERNYVLKFDSMK